MANTGTDSWGQSNPSTAFLLKCAKEKEKLRSRLRKELQEQMLFMLEGSLYSDILLGLNSNQPNSNIPHVLPAHRPVLQVRTPSFLDYVSKNKSVNEGVTSFYTNLGEAELQQFLKKAYTDDDIRRHECEALRLSKTYADIFREGKNLLNKHIIDTDDFEQESLNSESFVTPKTSPLTPDKLIHFTDMFRANQTKTRSVISEGPLKLNSHAQKNLLTKSGSKEIKLGPVISQDYSEGYDSELDIPHDEEYMSDMRRSPSAMLYTSADLSSTSIEIDESDFMMEDVCSSAEIPKPLSSENEESNMQIDSEDSPTTSGMVRSGTFDLHTQAPLEDYIDNNQINEDKCINHEVDSSNNILSRSDGVSFFLHDPTQKLNLFKNSLSGEAGNSDINEFNLPNSVQFPRIDGSITDSGFMSYSTFSMLSDSGIPNSFSSSLVLPSDNTISPDGVWKLKEEVMQSNLESSKKLSGSMFPFYIDINNLPEKNDMTLDRNKSPVINRSTIPKNNKDFVGMGEMLLGLDKKTQIMALNETRGRYSDRLTKAQSTTHLDDLKDTNSARRARPRSCYMYIDLDTVEPNRNEIPRDIKRAPSSISMFVDLNDDFSNTDSKLGNSNFSDTDTSKDLKTNTKAFGSAFDIGKTNATEMHRRKLSDSFLQAREHSPVEANYCSLRRPGENMSDSALNHIVKGSVNKSVSSNPLLPPKSIPDSCAPKKRISKWVSPSSSVETQFENDTLIQNCRMDACEQFSDGKTMAALLNEILHVEKKQNNHLVQEGKKNEFPNEAGLLPMSPILRRKTQNREIPKVSPPAIQFKASTKPQDIYAMTFPRPEKDQSLKENFKSQDNLNVGHLHKQLVDEASLKSQLDSEGNTKLALDNSDHDHFNDKSHLDSVSRSESSAFSMSAETTSSSGKLLIVEPVREGHKSPLSFSLPYEFEDDAETVYSEVSDLSSSLGGISGMASFERKWREGCGKDSGMSGLHNIYRMLEACSKLGEDLLRMFIEEIDTDVLVEAENKTIKAHKCILFSRCKYFAAILREPLFAETGVINLQGFSYASVHFALCHIYSGAINLPKDSNIIEMSLLADVLHLDTLVDVIILHLKTHYCHFFHKPCAHCVQGVLECLPLSVSCGFLILRDKCIRWLGRYFTRTWPNKVFAALPEDLREMCFQSTMKNLAVETVIEMTLSCDRLITTMPHVKWSEPVFGLVTRLLQESIHFMAKNFNRILCSEGFLILGKGQSWNVSTLEDDIISAVELMTPDVACKSSVKLSQILSLTESGGYSDYGEFTQNFIDLLHKVNRHCERYLIHNANKVVHCQSWACLLPDVQKKIRDAAVIVFEFEKPTAKPPRLSSLQRKLKKQKEDDEGVSFESATYPKFGKNGKFRESGENDGPKKIDHDLSGKKIVSPITEESHLNGLDSRREPHDVHDEDSLKEMQDLPHDHSQFSQNVYLDVSQHSSCAGLLESEENHSGTQCSDNPDSLDANEEMTESKDDVDFSLLTAEDISHEEKLLLSKAFDSASITSSDKNQNHAVKHEKNVVENRIFHTPDFIHLNDAEVGPQSKDKPPQRSVCDMSRNKKSPVKSLVPLPKSFNLPDKESLFSEPSCKDLVAEIDADSRMVTHCLQEAEMLEQQLSRKLLHQQQVATTSKLASNPATMMADVRRSPKTAPHKVQKSLSASQVKCGATPTRGKSLGKMTHSPSSPHVPRLLRPAESPKDSRTSKKSQSPKILIPSGQRSFRVVEGISATRQISPTKRLSTRVSKSKSSNISVVPDAKVNQPK